MAKITRVEQALPTIREKKKGRLTKDQKQEILRMRATGDGYGTIAKKVGLSINTVKSICRRNKTDEVPAVEQRMLLSGQITHCENCGQEIRQVAKRKKKRFCCDKCRNAWWNSHLDLVKRKAVYDFTCPNCGKNFQFYGDKRRKYCSQECYVADRFKNSEAHA